MNEEEVLQYTYAAKAVGLQFAVNGDDLPGYVAASNGDWRYGWVYWNPRLQDDHAFRLMVTLNLNVFHVMDTAYAMESETELTGEHTVRHRNDPAAATREAIFQAAVAIGKALP